MFLARCFLLCLFLLNGNVEVLMQVVTILRLSSPRCSLLELDAQAVELLVQKLLQGQRMKVHPDSFVAIARHAVPAVLVVRDTIEAWKESVLHGLDELRSHFQILRNLLHWKGKIESSQLITHELTVST